MPTRFVITEARPDPPENAVELCEHKGIGHPDTICDGVAEAASCALARAYLDAYGTVQHYNVDKALLIGGESAPRFGGGRTVTPMRLIICGRATTLPQADVTSLIRSAVRDHLATTLHCDPNLFAIEAVVRSGSPNLVRVIGSAAATTRVNDTSIGAGFAPWSYLESSVLHLADVLRSEEFRSHFPVVGDDYKVMGSRYNDEITLTVALAFVDREVTSVAHYFVLKARMLEYLQQCTGSSVRIVLNALDDPAAANETGVYLTVTGLSAEHGDDGQVGRGNRVGGLITPHRTMSMEAAAGKNVVAHAGKLYNVLAFEIARAVVAAEADVSQVSVQILSTIGDPITAPTLIAMRLCTSAGVKEGLSRRAREIAQRELEQIDELSTRIIRGGIRLF